MLLLTAGVLTLRTIVALASHSTFIYFLQPVLTDLLIGTAFLASALTVRPVVARLAGDFYPITDELHARPAMRRLFRRLTLLWATALLAKAAVVYMLLVSQPLATFVLAKSILVPITNASCIALTVIAATAVARHEGLLPGAHRDTSGMALQDFPRHPLTFGPSPVHPLRPAERPPRRRAGLGQARGLQQRAGVRRQQDPQARVPRPRGAGPGRRHPGLDRRRTSPTTPARSPRWPRTSG